MPNISDLIELADAMESKAVFVAEDRCVVVRNRNAQCRRCIEACPAAALSIEGNKLTYASRACVGCGGCTALCPTEALISLRPLDDDLAQAIVRSCAAAEGQAVFACARAASRKEADPDRYTEVPCLARLEESVLVGLAGRGVEEIVLVDGGCATCKFHACAAGIEATLASVNTLLAAEGTEVRAVLTSDFPDGLRVEEAAGLYGVSRRGFFTQSRSIAKEAAGKTVVTALKAELNTKPPTLRERLKMSEKGVLPQFNAVRRMRTLDAMDAIGPPAVPTITTRLWGSVEIDTEVCTSCGMCTVFCPTGALRKSELVPPASADGASTGSYLEFSVADCVQCGACADICLKKCLTVNPCVETAELFDFEPRLIHLPVPPPRTGILAGLKR